MLWTIRKKVHHKPGHLTESMVPSPLLPEVITFSCLLLALAGWGVAWRLARRTRKTSSTPPATQTGPLPQHSLPEIQTNNAHQLAETIPGMALVLGAMGQVLACNRAAQTRYGDSLHALLRHPNARNSLHTALNAPLMPESDIPTACSTTISLDVPIQRTIRLSMRRLPGTAGRDSLILTLLDDRSAIQAADRIRADFVAHASHELRTPLASLSGFIDLLRDGGDQTDPASRSLYLDIMHQQATRMQRLIDRLLYLSQLELKGHHHPHDRLDIGELFAIVLGEVMPRFKDSNRQLDMTHEDDLTVLADEDELVQVLLNLMENAIRYGTQPDRPLHVRLHARRSGPDDDLSAGDTGILLSVADNGPGIAAHHLPRLTERFYRITDAPISDSADTGQGTGLGLAIVRQILDRHGGRLRFVSTPGKGTTCLIWLPAAPPA